MYRCYLRNIEKNYVFSKDFESPYLMNKFLTKVRYSKKLQLVGKSKI